MGYDFGPVTLQTYVTTGVSQDNFGGDDTRLWTRVIFPLGNPFCNAGGAHEEVLMVSAEMVRWRGAGRSM